MEDNLPLITGLVGVLVGSIPPFVIQLFQVWQTRRKERVTWVLEAAKVAYAAQIEHAKFTKGQTTPFVTHVENYRQVYGKLARGKPLY